MNLKILALNVAALFSLLTLSNPSFALNTVVNYQGPVLDNIPCDTYWSNDGTRANGSEPAGAVSADVSNGLFTVALGDTKVTNMTALSATLFGKPDLQLRIWFNDGVHGSAALSPAQNLTPAPYAIQALNASNLLGTLPGALLTSIGNTNGGSGNFFVGPSGNSATSGS